MNRRTTLALKCIEGYDANELNEPARQAFPGNRLDFKPNAGRIPHMALPTESVTLSVEQIKELNEKLSKMRHDVNGTLTHLTLAVELLRLKPEDSERWLNLMAEQPPKIVADITKFSRDLEVALGVTRP